MKDEILSYLEAIELPETVKARIPDIEEGFRFLCGGREIDRLFVSDDRTENGREFLSLWGFVGSFWMEARDFLIKQEMDISSYYGAIKYLGMQYDQLDITGGATTSESYVKVEIETEKVRYSVLSATGANCSYLIRIVKELLIPSLKGDKLD